MSTDVTRPVVLDATVLSNFTSTGTVEHLASILDRPATVPAVRAELEAGHERGYEFLDDALEHLGSDIAVFGTENPPDAVAGEVRDRLDSGEAASLLGAMEHDGTLGTDDLAARTVATAHDVPVTGWVGILVVGIRRGVIDTDTANRWLDDWRTERGYYAPVDRIKEVIE